MKSVQIFTLFIAGLCFFVAPSYAQPSSGKISGQVVDAKGNAVPYATVTLLRTDSTVVNGDLTRENGNFTIENTGTGKFILRINILGYRERFVDNITVLSDAPVKLGKIAMAAEAQALAEVQITGEKAQMQMSIDKKVFNVEKTITATGGSATDVLRNIPSVAVDVEGEVQLRGKTATILIDGKPATLLGGDVASALQSLPSSAIQNVEVITNPSARFDAQGMAGIINIVTKKDNRLGLNGSVSIGAGTRDKYNGSLSLNLKNDKWNFFLNSSFRWNHNYRRTRNERWNGDGLLSTSSYENDRNLHGGFFNTIGAEYTLNERNSFTFTQNINSMRWGNTGVTDYYHYINGLPDSSQVRSSDNFGGPLSFSSSFDYRHKFRKPKQEVSANVTYATTQVNREQEFITNYLDQYETNYRPSVIQRAPGGGSNQSLNAQVDFTMPLFSPEGRLDIGAKTQLYWFESSNNAVVDSGTGFVPDPVLQNDYKYSQYVHAAYANLSNKHGKFGYQAGLRLESSEYEGTSSLLRNTNGGGNYSNQFINLFPSAYLSYELTKDQTVYLSYTRRVNRPSFFRLMPYKDVSNPMDTSMGNPGLIPEFIHNNELNYSRQFRKGHMVMASAYVQYTENLIDRIRTFYPDGKSISMPANLSSGLTFGTELTGKMQLLPIWDATVNFNFFRNEIRGGNVSPELTNSGTSWFSKLNTNLKLPKNFSLQLSGTYEAPKVAAQGKVMEVYWLDIALRKAFLDNKANLVLNISDIFDTRKYTNLYEFPSASQSIYRDRETRIANLTFTYRFGKSELRSANRRRSQQGGPAVKDRDALKQGEDGDSF